MPKSETQTLIEECARTGARVELGAIEAKLKQLYQLFPNEFLEAPPQLLYQPTMTPATDNGHLVRPATKRGAGWAKVATILEETAEPLSVTTLAERSGLSRQQIYNVMGGHKKDVVRDKGTYTLKKKNGK